jgi:Leucine-rich repeat (LRR) protein
LSLRLSNELKTICEEIVYLKNLTALDVRHNDLEELPPQLGMLSQLQTVSQHDTRQARHDTTRHDTHDTRSKQLIFIY